MDSTERNPPCESHTEDSSVITIKRKRRKIAPGDSTSMVCVVCGSAAFGYNFDVISCESCKAFFRRNAQKAANRLSQCVRDGACSVNSNSRKHCPACRMKKCLDAGMRKELITPIEKLVNRANYRGKRSERKSSSSVRDDSCDLKSVNSDEILADKQGTHSHSSTEEPETPTESKRPHSSQPCCSSDEGNNPIQSSFSNDVKDSPTSTDCYSAPTSTMQNPAIPENFANLPPSILQSLPPELLAKAKMLMSPRSPVAEENDIAHQCAMMLYGKTNPNQQVVKQESPPADPASFMAAMNGKTPLSDMSLEDQILKFMNPIEAVKMMGPFPCPKGRTSKLREEIFLEYFDQIKSGLMNIAKPLKKEEIIKTHLSEMPQNLEGSFNQMENMIRRVIAVLKCLPQFVALTRELQIALLKRSIHGLFAFCGALAYDANRNAFRIIYEEDNGEITTFYLDFETYVTQGLKDIRSTSWESFSSILHNDKAHELIKVNKIIFNQINSFTRNDRFLITTLMCARFFGQSAELCDVNLNEGMTWLLKRTHTELLLFIGEYVARKSPDVDTEEQFQQIVSLFDAIKPLERAGEVLSHEVRLDGLNPLMREFLTFSKYANMNGAPKTSNHPSNS